MKYLILLQLIFCTFIVTAQNNVTWNMTTPIASSATGNEHPRIAIDGSGNPLVIWHHSHRVMFSRWSGTTFTTPVILNPLSVQVAGASWMGPDIAAHGDTVYVVYKLIPEASDTCHIFCLHSFDGGINFSLPVRVDYINDSISRFPAVTTDDSGNPLIAFMKFNASFGDSRWVVSRSTDYGLTFSTDVKASGWSSMTSAVCDCCPGAIAASGNNAAVIYRDNNANIRDIWAGLSTNGGSSFTGGMNIDQQNWMINSCPATGPDGLIIGDTLYSVYMSSASGMSRVYLSKSSLSAATGSAGTLITGNIPGLALQNYPRIATHDGAMGIAWKQSVNGANQCAISFTNNIGNGLPLLYDTIAMNSVTNTDVALTTGTIYVVWQDDASGQVKFKKGNFTPVAAYVNDNILYGATVYYNAAQEKLMAESPGETFNLIVRDFTGRIIMERKTINSRAEIPTSQLSNGVYFVDLIHHAKARYGKRIYIYHE